ncbi:hypothetical protein AWE51_08900 [Aquimarina aggregata]|uniref:Gp5/Type VI secretion system Vgr protein OB-fold domain-containing protein n=1 Tax=Aquimarina aggregata TaxID=1642818 RepID=A0A162ZF70_9FLAO|nr:type VI secretion system tip protein VgrG [Aquimarina aggregata]KZS39758.1 hypothetical protein AWE51_08900 [Aquimarina aggregata]
MAKVLQQSDGVLSFDISINGSKIKDVVEVSEISIHTEVNRISSAIISIEDGGAIGAVNNPFTNSEGNDFIPGNEIKISLGYDNKRELAFQGIIISHRLIVKRGKSQLMITCKDKAVNMTKGRFNSIFQDKKDSDAIKSIVDKYGLKLTMDATTQVMPILMQYNCSDWDFTVIRAEMNDMTVLTKNNNLIIKKNNFGDTPQYEINSSQYVVDIDLNLDSEKISDSYQVTAWDDKTQKENAVSITINDNLSQGNLSAKKISGAVDNGTFNQYSSASLSKNELKSWGSSLANKAILSKVQGKIVVPGTTSLTAGDIITISGFSARFNGKAYLSQVIHEIKDGSWLTTLHVGRAPKWHSYLPDIRDTMASGLIPATSGPQIGKVKKIDEDPEGKYRVLVYLPTFSGTGQTTGIWARLSFPYATADAGFFFFPEIDDEVVVTFINNDPRFPVITGALYNTKNKPKEVADSTNQYKSIYSKSGINIRFDDKDKIITIETPGGNSFTMDDKNKSITAKDISGNSLLLDQSGIAIDSSKDLKLSAKGNIDISASAGINIEANSDVAIDGTNIQLSAKASLTAKGNASAEISAAGQTTVKGAMVMIN